MARRVNKIQVKLFVIAVYIRKGHDLAFDGDSSLPFDVHCVQDLVAEISFFHQARPLNQAVGKGGFSVVYVGDDAEVPYFGHIFVP